MNPINVRLMTLVAATTVAASTFADFGASVRANTVIPVVFEDNLSLRENRRGDRFYARVEDSRDLPYGTRLEGVVNDVRPSRNGRPASMDAEFTGAVLPGGNRVAIRAIPISLDSRSVQRGRDGRLTADAKKVRSEHYVVGGVVGGLLVGSLIKKPFEGAFVGALAGILIAESERSRSKNADLVVRRGQRMGALIERDFDFEYDRRYDDRDRDDRSDRNDRYDDGDRYEPSRSNDRYEDRDGSDRFTLKDRFEDDRRAEISFNGRLIRFGEAQPYRVGDTWMVPLERTAESLGLQVQSVASDRFILVEDDDSILRLEQDSADYRLNSKRGSMSRAVIRRDGETFVPLEILAATVTGRVTVNGTVVEMPS